MRFRFLSLGLGVRLGLGDSVSVFEVVDDRVVVYCELYCEVCCEV